MESSQKLILAPKNVSDILPAHKGRGFLKGKD